MKKISTLTKIKRFYHHLLFEEYRLSYEALALYRIAFAVVYIVVLGVPSFTWLSQMALYFFEPQPFNAARLFATRLPDFWVLLLLDITVLLAMVSILFGFKTKRMSWLLTFCLLIGYTLQYSLGKIDHTIVLVLLPAIMSFSGWEKRFSLDAKYRTSLEKDIPDGYAPFIVALVLGFGIFTAALPKLFGGWLLLDQSAVIHQYYARYYSYGGPALLAPLFIEGVPPWAWKIADYSAVSFELLFLPAVLNKRVFQGFCVAALLFHVINLLVLNIAFTSNLLAYLLFIRWEVVLQLLRHRIPKRWSRWMTYRSFLVALLIVLVQYYGCVYAFRTFMGEDSATLALFVRLFNLPPLPWNNLVLLAIALPLLAWQVRLRFSYGSN